LESKTIRSESAGALPGAAASTGDAPEPATGASPVDAAAPGEVPADSERTVFDPRDLLDTYVNDEGLARASLEKFIARTEEWLDGDLSEAFVVDSETALREAHTIKGTAQTLSGKDLGAEAARLEKAFRENDRPEIAAALPLVREAFLRFKAAVEAYLREPK